MVGVARTEKKKKTRADSLSLLRVCECMPGKREKESWIEKKEKKKREERKSEKAAAASSSSRPLWLGE